MVSWEGLQKIRLRLVIKQGEKGGREALWRQWERLLWGWDVEEWCWKWEDLDCMPISSQQAPSRRVSRALTAHRFTVASVHWQNTAGGLFVVCSVARFWGMRAQRQRHGSGNGSKRKLTARKWRCFRRRFFDRRAITDQDRNLCTGHFTKENHKMKKKVRKRHKTTHTHQALTLSVSML